VIRQGEIFLIREQGPGVRRAREKSKTHGLRSRGCSP
jgi:hypothetical protein